MRCVFVSKNANISTEAGLVRFILKYITPHHFWLVLALSASAVLMALQVYGAILIGDFVSFSIAKRIPDLFAKISLYFGLCL